MTCALFCMCVIHQKKKVKNSKLKQNKNKKSQVPTTSTRTKWWWWQTVFLGYRTPWVAGIYLTFQRQHPREHRVGAGQRSVDTMLWFLQLFSAGGSQVSKDSSIRWIPRVRFGGTHGRGAFISHFKQQSRLWIFLPSSYLLTREGQSLYVALKFPPPLLFWG